MGVDVDVVVVGSGLNGAWAAKVLAEEGLDVLVLEAGPELDFGRDVGPAATSPGGPPATDEARARHPAASALMSFHRANAHLFADERAYPMTAPDDAPFNWIRSRQVGGRGVLWARVALRMSDHEFFASRSDGLPGVWPFGHDELAEHYAAVETRHGVLGTAGGGPALPDNVFAGPAELSPAEAHLAELVAARWPARRVIPRRVIPTAGDATPWPPFTPQGSVLGDALASGRVTVRPGTVASRVEPSADGREVTVRHLASEGGAEGAVRARAVVLAASTIESVRLLLLSSSPAHPGGLGNARDLLGRGLMDHVGLRLVGTLPAAFADAPPVAGGGYVPRFTNVPGGESTDFARGYGIIVNLQPPARRDLAVLATSGEMLPYASNRVTLDPAVRDALGLPAPHVACRLGDNELRMVEHQRATLRELADALGVQVLAFDGPLPPGTMIHECGGAPMGDSPDRSVTDPWGRVWEAPRVVVSDGACWPSGGYQNPTLTMLAATRRSALRLAGDLRAAG